MVLTIEDFNDTLRYTTTYIASTNWKLDHVAFYNHIKIDNFNPDPLDGVKRASVKLDVPDGTILQVKYKDSYGNVHVRGCGEQDESSTSCFSNSTTVVMYIGKIVVLKIPSRGKIQITGCRTEEQVYTAIHSIRKYIEEIKDDHPEVSRITTGEIPCVLFTSVMNNIKFDLGFRINKMSVHDFLYKNTDFNTIYNNSKYAGIIAKIEVEGMKDLLYVKHRFINGKWYKSTADWNEWLSMLTPKDRQKESTVERCHTFLIFHSGKVIQSGPRHSLMRDVFGYFISLMNGNRQRIEDLNTELSH